MSRCRGRKAASHRSPLRLELLCLRLQRCQESSPLNLEGIRPLRRRPRVGRRLFAAAPRRGELSRDALELQLLLRLGLLGEGWGWGWGWSWGWGLG